LFKNLLFICFSFEGHIDKEDEMIPLEGDSPEKKKGILDFKSQQNEFCNGDNKQKHSKKEENDNH